MLELSAACVVYKYCYYASHLKYEVGNDYCNRRSTYERCLRGNIPGIVIRKALVET